jgi:HEAT repeat protein
MSPRTVFVGLVVLLCICGVIPMPRATGSRAAFAAETSVAELVAVLGSEDSTQSRAAYIELRNRKDAKTPALLAARLPEFSGSAQIRGVLVLDAYKAKPLKKPLRKLLKCSSPYLRFCAALMLHDHGAKGMITVVVGELGDEELPSATWTTMMRRLRGGRLPSDEKLMRALLAPVVVGSEADAIREIVIVMNDAKASAAIPAFEALLADERPGTCAIAAAFLRARGQDRDNELAAALRAGEVQSADVYLLDSIMTKVGAPRGAPVIVDALIDASRADANSSSLRAIVQLLGQLSDERALPRLRELTEHKSKSIAKAAARAVVALSGTEAKVGSSQAALEPADTVALTKMSQDRDVDALLSWLQDESATRRLAAADVLRRMDDHSGLNVVLAEFASTAVLSRRDAVRVAGQFRVDATVAPLIEATLDADATVRSYARIALNTTLGTLFPQRRFRLTGRGEIDDSATREARAERLRVWWTQARDAAW